MPTTSLKLPDDLKTRVANAAQELGISPHAFMVAAIEQAATAAEQRALMIANARTVRDAMLEVRRGVDADEVHAYLKAKVSGKKVKKPRASAWHT